MGSVGSEVTTGEYEVVATRRQKLLHAPHKINAYKSLIGKTFPHFQNGFKASDIPSSNRIVRHIGMDENIIIDLSNLASDQENITLHTDGIIDCIGISVYDPVNKKAGLFHFSKMNRGLELDKFLKEFSSKSSSIHLTSAYYTHDLIRVLNRIEDQGFRIQGFNVYDCCFAPSPTGTPSDIFVDKDCIPDNYVSNFTNDIANQIELSLDTTTGQVSTNFIMPKAQDKKVLDKQDPEPPKCEEKRVIFSDYTRKEKVIINHPFSRGINERDGYGDYSLYFSGEPSGSFPTHCDIHGQNKDDFLQFSIYRHKDNNVTATIATYSDYYKKLLSETFPEHKKSQYQMVTNSVSIDLKNIDEIEKLLKIYSGIPTSLINDLRANILLDPKLKPNMKT